VKVFVSWSGVASREVALVLADWFPNVIQSIEPFVSATDISKGANWAAVLQQELADSDFGVVCLAPDNLQSPWLNYEAGAIANSVESLVCPVLFHVEKDAVKPPLAQLQLTSLDQPDVLLLMHSMNKATKSPLPVTALEKAVTMWWPKLAEELGNIDNPTGIDQVGPELEPEQPQTEVSEMVKELLQIVRGLVDNSLFPGSAPRSVWREQQPAKGSSRRPGIAWDPEDLKLFDAKDHNEKNPYVALLILLEEFGFNGQKGAVTTHGFDLYTTDDLPETLPPRLSAELSRAAATNRYRVRLMGPNRMFSFGKTGYVTELPAEPAER
jgi:hypothetical protein